MPAKIALLQVNPLVGDINGNKSLVEKMANISYENGASLAVTSELVISGYPPRDLLLQTDFVRTCRETALNLKAKIPVLVGTPLDSESNRALPGNGVVRCGDVPREVTKATPSNL